MPSSRLHADPLPSDRLRRNPPTPGIVMTDVAAGDPHFAELKRTIERTVELEETTIVCGDRSWPWFRVIDPDKLLERAAAADSLEEQERIDPFWAATWRAAEGLGKFLERIPLQGVRVLELGCGSGRSGLAAAALGAQVTMTDAVELALQVARLNLWPVADRVSLHRLNWGHDRLDEPPFPIIIGADIVYDPNLFPRLEQCARQHLAPGGRVYLSEPHRHSGDKFEQWMPPQGWRVQVHSVQTDPRRTPIRIFECWLSSPAISPSSTASPSTARPDSAPGKGL
ncbi:MAG: methyltransferase domain-containing protein [Planctomycetota bacterium]|nr:MAG: methyltransferase domain-containing protein [Planctomycetota bacterium]